MIINGRQLAQEITDELKSEIANRGLSLSLTAILVGTDPDLKKFLNLKKLAAQNIGISFVSYEFPESILPNQLIKEVLAITKSPDNDGVFIELPLPSNFNAEDVLSLIPTEKDIDLLSPKSEDLYYRGHTKISPPTVQALRTVFKKFDVAILDKKVAVFGQGKLVGKPIAHWLEKRGAQVNRIDEQTKNPEEFSRMADIVISGVGQPHFIKSAMIKSCAVVVDFGFGKKDGAVLGDIDPEVASKASLFATVPGGMGPIVIAMTLKNLITLTT